MSKQYWWVNHAQTAKQEIQGGYLWAPKKEANGARSQFYDNMRKASPGDMVLSFSNGNINYVGLITDFALSAPKPQEFGEIGSYWLMEGWLLPVAWKTLPTKVIPKSIIAEIRPLLPEKYSPIKAETGNGNQKAYFASISEKLFTLMCEKASFTHISIDLETPIRQEIINKLEAAEEVSILSDKSLSDTEKKQQIKARKGQGDFRKGVLQVEKQCRITGMNNPYFLIASHIKPWRACVTAHERLDKFNGLLLTPNIDHLFDLGFISFKDNGDLMVSSRITLDDLKKMGLETPLPRTLSSFRKEQAEYLAYHRNFIFLEE